VHDLFALSEVAEPELAKRARKPRTDAARPIHISGYDRNGLALQKWRAIPYER